MDEKDLSLITALDMMFKMYIHDNDLLNEEEIEKMISTMIDQKLEKFRTLIKEEMTSWAR